MASGGGEYNTHKVYTQYNFPIHHSVVLAAAAAQNDRGSHMMNYMTAVLTERKFGIVIC